MGEVRDGASELYALSLKSRILGENPCNVDRVFRKIKQFGSQARQAGGVCGIEMAMMDLAGKAWGVPCWQMLGGKFRDRVRLYADTTERDTPQEQGQLLKERMDLGITFLKQDFGIGLLKDVPGALSMPAGTNIGGGERVMHPFTGIEITDKGIAWLSDWVGKLREVIGMDIPLSSDHYGHIGVNSCIKLARAMEKWNLAWMEDMVPWQFGRSAEADQGFDDDADSDRRGHLPEGTLHEADRHGCGRHDPPRSRQCGRPDRDEEDWRLRDGTRRRDGDAFRRHADLVHGQRPLRGGDRELHRARTPLDRRAVVGEPGQDDGGNALVEKGFAIVPDSPGLGVELNEEAVKAHLRPKSGYFAPTPEWDAYPEQRSTLELERLATPVPLTSGSSDEFLRAASSGTRRIPS